MPLKHLVSLLLLPTLCQNMVQGASLPLSSTTNTGSGCGGHITGSGEIRYKVGEQTSPNELCVWTLINPDYPLLSVELTEENFADEGDHVEIFYYVNGSLLNPVPGGGPHCDGPILSRHGQFCLVPSSLIFLVFRSNQVSHGLGFSIKIEPSGAHLPPTGAIYEPNTLPHGGGVGDYVDYVGGFKSSKVVSWTLVNPNEFVLYRYNITPPCSSTNSTSPPPKPSFSIFTATQGSPSRLEGVCGRIERPIRLVQGPVLGATPFIIIYENGRRTYPAGEIKFYWDLEEPPLIWQPEKGAAGKFGGGSVTTFFSGMVILLITLFIPRMDGFM